MMTITLHNVGQDATGHTYTVEVSVNGRRIDQLVVKGHNRADGWARLLEQVAAAKREMDAVEQYDKMRDWVNEKHDWHPVSTRPNTNRQVLCRAGDRFEVGRYDPLMVLWFTSFLVPTHWKELE